jgi:hypothetical protein
MVDFYPVVQETIVIIIEEAAFPSLLVCILHPFGLQEQPSECIDSRGSASTGRDLMELSEFRLLHTL